MRSPGDDITADALGTLRAADRDRYLQVLLGASADRAALVALFHLNVELARIADHAREPMAGYIRLQWWRDALTALAAGTPPPHPVLALLAEPGLVERLPATALLALVDAREVELDATPLQRLDDLEAHAAATAGALNALTARLCGADSASQARARAIGTAYGLLGIVRAVPFVLRRPQPLLPEDLLAGQGLSVDRLGSPSAAREALKPVLAQMIERAAAALGDGERAAPRRQAPAFAPALLARQDLARLRRLDLDVFDARLVERPPWTMALLILAAARGRF